MASSNPVAAALAAGRPLLADGAMATNLFSMGLRPGDPPEPWNAHHPDRVESLHRAFVAAGADLLLTNTFGGNRHRLRRFGLDDRLVELNRQGVLIAIRAAARSARPIPIAGCIGPTGATHPSAWQEDAPFDAQAAVLAAAGADLLWIETMGDADEMRAAGTAAAATGLPFVLTASFDRHGRTLAGLDAVAFARMAAALPGELVALGANCGEGPATTLAAVTALRAATPTPLVAKANAGLPAVRDGSLHYPETPARLAAYARAAVAAGAGIVGGCCGTTPKHVAAMRAALDDTGATS